MEEGIKPKNVELRILFVFMHVKYFFGSFFKQLLKLFLTETIIYVHNVKYCSLNQRWKFDCLKSNFEKFKQEAIELKMLCYSFLLKICRSNHNVEENCGSFN